MVSVAVRAQTEPLSYLDALRYTLSAPDLIKAFGLGAAKGRSYCETFIAKYGRRIIFDRLRRQ